MEGPAKFFPIVLGFFIASTYLTSVDGEGVLFIDKLNRSLITI